MMPADLPEHSDDVGAWVSDRDEGAARRLMGIATRVLACLRERPAPSIWESFALAALPVAALITLACVLLGSSASEPPDDAAVIADLMLETQLPTAR